MQWIKSEIENPSKSEVTKAVVAGMKKTNDHAEPTKNAKQQQLHLFNLMKSKVCGTL